MLAELSEVVQSNPLDWLPEVTLIYLLASSPWRTHMPKGTVAELLGVLLITVVAAALVMDGLTSSPAVWLGIVVLHALWIVTAYSCADNHFYLIGYWCATVGLALALDGASGNALLAADSRLLIGLTFLLAFLAKACRRRYRDGSFFTHALLFDPRFLFIALCAGGLDKDSLVAHTKASTRVAAGKAGCETAPVPVQLRRIAAVLTVWTLLIEVAVAAAFLWPGEGSELARTSLLLLFAASTFALVPVPSFGQILLIILLGSVQDVSLRVMIMTCVGVLGLSGFMPNLVQRVCRMNLAALLDTSQLPTELSSAPQKSAMPLTD